MQTPILQALNYHLSLYFIALAAKYIYNAQTLPVNRQYLVLTAAIFEVT